MNTLSFDIHGHLFPYELIETDWESFVETFGWNDRRTALLDLLQKLLLDMNTLSIESFMLWIDGSFVTKKEQPNDIDAVVVLPSAFYRKFERELRALRDQFDALDLYFVRMIDESEHDHFLYTSDRSEWLFQFTTTRPDRVTRRKFSKGFLQITFGNESALKRT